jgi:hypothetical protein
MYNDDYESCDKTFVTLRVYSTHLSPQEITHYLGIAPSKIIEKEETEDTLMPKPIPYSAWF